MRLLDVYDELWKAIVRPPRDIYSIADLGPIVFPLRGLVYTRDDFVLTNPRDQKLHCSLFEPHPQVRPAEKLPCVIYLHGNCSSRMEALTVLPTLLPLNVTVAAIDLAGSGLSDGEYVSLGYYERDDVETLIAHLRETGRITCIGIWGRSMGAVTALMHAHRDHSIAGIVCDSPFTNLRRLAEELAEQFLPIKLPKFLVGFALNFVRNTIQQKAAFDIGEINPISTVEMAFVPAIFVAAREDKFIRPHHARELHDKYNGDKALIEVGGDHNSLRPDHMNDAVACFFYQTLQVDTLDFASFYANNDNIQRLQELRQETIQWTCPVAPHSPLNRQGIHAGEDLRQSSRRLSVTTSSGTESFEESRDMAEGGMATSDKSEMSSSKRADESTGKQTKTILPSIPDRRRVVQINKSRSEDIGSLNSAELGTRRMVRTSKQQSAEAAGWETSTVKLNAEIQEIEESSDYSYEDDDATRTSRMTVLSQLQVPPHSQLFDHDLSSEDIDKLEDEELRLAILLSLDDLKHSRQSRP